MEQSSLTQNIQDCFAAGKLGIEPGSLSGTVRVPQSKSMAHRALIMAFLSGDLSLARIDACNVSDDIAATRAALEQLQAVMNRSVLEDAEPVIIDCKESGSTLRFLIPLVAVLGIPTRFIGRGRLPRRPIREYEQVFAGSGAQMIYLDETGLSLPLEIRGKMTCGDYELPGNVSSQYISGLLMALSAAEGRSTLRLTTVLESKPYVDMTCQVMEEFGVQVESSEAGYTLPGGGKPHREAGAFAVERDYSQAAFWLVANYLGADIVLEDLPEGTRQGDRAIVKLLEGLRATEEQADETGERAVFEMDARDVPDLVPVFAVAASATGCETRIIHGERLRLKESDRIASTADLLSALGADVTITADGLQIRGRSIRKEKKVFQGGSVNSYADHRLVMAAAIAALGAEGPIWISAPGAVEKSYPGFFEEYCNLGGEIYGINVG